MVWALEPGILSLSLGLVIEEQASQWHEIYCDDLQAMSSNPTWVELGVRSTFV